MPCLLTRGDPLTIEVTLALLLTDLLILVTSPLLKENHLIFVTIARRPATLKIDATDYMAFLPTLLLSPIGEITK